MRRNKVLRLMALFLLIIVLALGLVGCGGEEEEVYDGPTTGEEVQEEVEEGVEEVEQGFEDMQEEIGEGVEEIKQDFEDLQEEY